MLEKLGQPARVLSAMNLSAVAETFIRGRALRHLEKGRSGRYSSRARATRFSPPTVPRRCGPRRSARDMLLKATKVDGIYDKDPKKHADATALRPI